eukprot:scaffold90928_cov28-Tisochrysis_lutea.AAC.6
MVRRRNARPGPSPSAVIQQMDWRLSSLSRRSLSTDTTLSRRGGGVSELGRVSSLPAVLGRAPLELVLALLLPSEGRPSSSFGEVGVDPACVVSQ